MECEICGRKIVGKKHTIIVEGSELTVCERCKELGVEAKPAKAVVRVVKRVSTKTKPIVEDYELVENFHEIVRREREKRGWTQEELAKRIQEKATLIRKIEKGEITPEKEVVEKLEKVLDINLREKVEEVKIQKSMSITPTLGDVVVIRRKKRS